MNTGKIIGWIFLSIGIVLTSMYFLLLVRAAEVGEIFSKQFDHFAYTGDAEDVPTSNFILPYELVELDGKQLIRMDSLYMMVILDTTANFSMRWEKMKFTKNTNPVTRFTMAPLLLLRLKPTFVTTKRDTVRREE